MIHCSFYFLFQYTDAEDIKIPVPWGNVCGKNKQRENTANNFCELEYFRCLTVICRKYLKTVGN